MLVLPLILRYSLNTSCFYTRGKDPLHYRPQLAILCEAVHDDRIIGGVRVDNVCLVVDDGLLLVVGGVASRHGGYLACSGGGGGESKGGMESARGIIWLKS